jgi:hypothetical protein
MTLRKSIVTLALVAALSAASLGRPNAAVVSTPPPPPVTSVTLGVGGGLAVGVIAAAGLLVIYDIWLKATSQKNWDGTPIVQKPIARHHH